MLMEKLERQKGAVKAAIQVSEEHHFSGPLPRPEDLAKYDQIVPGAAARIIQMAEKEMSHRHDNEKKLSKSIIWTTVMSIIFAFLSVIILSLLCFYAIYKDYPTVAASIAVGAIAAVAGVFLYKSSKKEKGK